MTCYVCGNALEEEDFGCGICIDCSYDSGEFPSFEEPDWDEEELDSLGSLGLTRPAYQISDRRLVFSRGASLMVHLIAENHNPYETGGLLFGPKGDVDKITHATHLENIHLSRSFYEPDMQKFMDQLIFWEKRGLSWKGWWHSHPWLVARPSGIDFDNHKHPVAMVIYSGTEKDIRAYDWKKDSPNELEELQVESE